MPDFDNETSRTATSHRLERAGPPRVEVNISTDATSAGLRLTIGGAANAQELVNVLMIVRNRIRTLYGLP